MQPDTATTAKALSNAGVDSAVVEDAGVLGVLCRVDAADAIKALAALKESSHEFDFMVDMFGVDTGEHVDVVYHLRSFSRDEEITVKYALDYGGELVSAWRLFPAALMPERECAEMFGLTLEGHPNPKHLLLTEFSRPLLLKSELIRTAEEVRDR